MHNGLKRGHISTHRVDHEVKLVEVAVNQPMLGKLNEKLHETRVELATENVRLSAHS